MLIEQLNKKKAIREKGGTEKNIQWKKEILAV